MITRTRVGPSTATRTTRPPPHPSATGPSPSDRHSHSSTRTAAGTRYPSCRPDIAGLGSRVAAIVIDVVILWIVNWVATPVYFLAVGIFALGLVGLLTAKSSPTRQRIGDRVAGTIVVRAG